MATTARLRLRLTTKVGPFRFTLSQRGISASAGAGPVRVSRGADGKVRRTVRVPGAGLYDTKVVGGQKPKKSTRPAAPGFDYVLCPECGVTLKASATSTRLRCAQCAAEFPKSAAQPAPRPAAKQRMPASPPPAPAPPPDGGRKGAVAGGVLVLAVVGLIMSMQPVTMLTGSTMVWVGVAVAAAGTALAFFLRAQTWVRVVAALLLVVSVGNALTIEHELSKKRGEFTNSFNNE